MTLSETVKQRFEEKVSTTTTCSHIWNGAKTNGYGVMHVPSENGRGTVEYAHRIAWSHWNNRPIPELFEGKPAVIMHKCDRRDCVSPQCLVLGNQKTNMDDKASKGRANPKKKYRGPSLTDAELHKIYMMFHAGWSNYFISSYTRYSQPHLSYLKKKWQKQKTRLTIIEMLALAA